MIQGSILLILNCLLQMRRRAPRRGLARRPGRGGSARIAQQRPTLCGIIPLVLFLFVHRTLSVSANTLCVDVNSTNPIPPYADWSTAGTNIQDAIDAAIDGDTVFVNDGTYATGGGVMAGDLTNRVALNKALTVQSVNGPGVTTIQGAYTPATGYGASSVRCAWLTNGASLVGFTLLSGATRNTGDLKTLASGGGVWCASTNVLVANCIIVSNKAAYYGGGVYQGTLSNCLVLTNSGIYGGGAYNAVWASCRVISNSASYGGGAYGGTLRNCFVGGNSAASGSSQGGGVASGTLYNCTLTRNSALNGGGVYACSVSNCIVFANASLGASATNYSGGTFSYSCSTPLPPGSGNIAVDPQLLEDGMHLANNSPCRGAGANSVASGVDIDGQPWANPPSMGCDEWEPAPLIPVPPRIQLNVAGSGFSVMAHPAGMEPLVCWWLRGGVPLEDVAPYSSAHTTNLTCNSIGELVGGAYQVVVSNSFGMVTSAVAQAAVHCVDAAGTNPVPPYATWDSAATDIQAAVTAAAAGDWVLVTNGIYAAGGKAMDGIITNRVTVDKAVTVLGLNGPGGTIIQGNWGTNGPAAVRCAWLTNGAVLGGFTLCGGATRAIGNPPKDSMIGGGVWASSTSATVFNCMILTNLAANTGGGAYRATLFNCTLAGNRAVGSGQAGVGIAGAGAGGGAYACNLTNCVITGNFADQSEGGGTYSCNLSGCALTLNSSYMYGGAAYRGTLLNCTVSGNISAGYGGYGGAVASATLTNCIVYANTLRGTGFSSTNYYNCTLAYSDSDPLPAGTGNIDANPGLTTDGIHIGADSPCRGAGTGVPLGTDIDGQAWANPPPMGCDEWQSTALAGGQPQFELNPARRSFSFVGSPIGQPPFAWAWIKDGVTLQDDPHYAGSGTSNLVVNPFDASDAGAYQFVVSNAFGVATSQVTQVTIHCVDASATNPVPPYATWNTAAGTIQDAIGAANAGEIVLVADGVYSTGGKYMYGDVTNRVVLDKALTVMSMNGYASTIIQGASGTAVNGPAAVRCAWLTNNATLVGFTLQGGATRVYPSGSYGDASFCAGAAWCSSGSAAVANCLIRANTASQKAAAIYQGTILNCAINKNTMASGTSYGGMVYLATLNNCTIAGNTITGSGVLTMNYTAGPYQCTANNCILTGNGAMYNPNYYSVTATYCFTTPALAGVGNLTGDPLFVNDWHLALASPCRGAGSAAYAAGADMDGEAWSNPPSIGCDEPVESGLVGSLSVSLLPSNLGSYANHSSSLFAQITGRAGRLAWDFGDGTTATNAGCSTAHTWTNPGIYNVVLTAYNADNPGGVSGNLQLNVRPVLPPVLSGASWTTNGFQFQFSAQSNLFYTIQWATNLVPPIAWGTVRVSYAGADGILQVTDSAAKGSARFYRVQPQ